MSRRNKSDHWVSHNKVLNSTKSLRQAGRNPNFETEETKLLISLWGKPQVQRDLITMTKKLPIIQNIAQEMVKSGYKRSPEEINTRIKNLKCFYNRMKKDIEMGILREPTWRHYEAMEKVLNREVFGNNKEIAENIRRRKVGLNITDELEALIVPKSEPMDVTPKIKIEIEEDFPLMVESDTPMVFPTKDVPEVPTKPKLTLFSKQPPPLAKPILPVPTTTNSTMKVIFVNKIPAKEPPKVDPTPKVSPEKPETISFLLKQIIDQQKLQMEIESERLSLEKERFKFEQEIGGKLLEVLPALLAFTKNINQLEDEDVDI